MTEDDKKKCAALRKALEAAQLAAHSADAAAGAAAPYGGAEYRDLCALRISTKAEYDKLQKEYEPCQRMEEERAAAARRIAERELIEPRLPLLAEIARMDEAAGVETFDVAGKLVEWGPLLKPADLGAFPKAIREFVAEKLGWK